ncbi:cytochrome C [Azoarcus sp. DN11]|nr:cytochrome C [Azoarcus sp. DN11]
MTFSRRGQRLGQAVAVLALCAGLSFECVAVGPPPRDVATEANVAVGEPQAPFALDDSARIEAGRKRFNKTCAGYCHGFEGVGGRAPDFKGRKDLPVPVMFETITKGRVGADVMPPWGAAFSAEQIWELVAYLRYLGAQ